MTERAPERLVYLDTFLPEDGQSLAGLLSPEVVACCEERARTMGDAWCIPHDPPDAHRRTDCREIWDGPLFAHFNETAARAQRELPAFSPRLRRTARGNGVGALGPGSGC